MGGGIAQVVAASGLSVIMNDINEQFVLNGMKAITRNLARQVGKGSLSQDDSKAVLGRIRTSTSLKDMAEADMVVEATENQDIVLHLPGSSTTPAPDMPSRRPTPRPSPSAGSRPDRTSRQGHRHAFHEPGAGDETLRGHPGDSHPRRRPSGSPGTSP